MRFTPLLLVLSASGLAGALETLGLLPRHAEAAPPPSRPPSAPKPPVPVPRPDLNDPPPILQPKPNQKPDTPEVSGFLQASQSAGVWSATETVRGSTATPTVGGIGQESSSETSTTKASSLVISRTLAGEEPSETSRASASQTSQISAAEGPSETSRASQSPIPESTGARTMARVDSVFTAYCLFACIYHAKWLLWAW